MDYSKVAPPTQSSNDHNTAFADALARARQIAAKIGGGESDTTSLKRPYEGIPEAQPDAKKMAAVNDPIGAQLKALADQQRAQQAVQAAANAAAQINAKLGISGGGQPTQQEFGGEWSEINSMPEFGGDWSEINSMPPGAVPQVANNLPGLGGMVTTENYHVPDRMVGLVIGKGGENIAMIQSETGVKVQFAQDSAGLADRPCTLTGSTEGISKAKDLITRIISKGQGLPDNASTDGVTMEEVMIPGNKVGLVIGKGGENIKMLQEKAMVKMVMIQDSNAPTAVDKPLRITGEPGRVAQAKEMVFDLLAEKEAQAATFGGNEYGANTYGGGGGHFGGGGNKQEVTVPRSLVGVIIGKGGDMIKKITQDTGAKIQLKPDDGQGPERVCMVMGSPDKVQAAVEFIQSLLDSANQGGMGRGRGRGRGGPGGEGEPRPGGFGQKEETTYIVPADKTGLVIGKGGETVKEINRVTGAWVELSRDRPPNPHDRVFKISGSSDQIQQAIRMVCEKAGLPPPRDNRGPGGPPQGFNGTGFDQNRPQNMGGPPQGGAPQGWGNAYNQWNPQPAPEQPKPQPDQNAAAWAAYYQNYYQQPGAQPGQPGQPGQPQPGQQPPQQPPQQQQQQPQPQQAPPQQPYGAPQQPAAINPVTGQPDYSAQWAEYYRQQGMHYHAQAILQQAAQQQQAAHQPGQPMGHPQQ